MGTPACILVEREKYTPEKLLSDAIVAAFYANLRLHYHTKIYSEDGSFSYAIMNILDHSYEEDPDKQFIFHVDSKDDVDLFESYQELDLDPNKKLCKVGWIEEVQDHGDVVFRFMYEYLRLNPKDLFWVPDYDWVYEWKDMKKIGSMPFDSGWYYTDPKMIK